MKTALFSPIYINPQAYYVFPQLYNIVPEVLILVEPCVFTGVLMVENSDNTITKLYKNTKSIDLTEFANSIITISLYTDIGATVLGQWKLAGKTELKEFKLVNNKNSITLLGQNNVSDFLSKLGR